MSVNWTDLENLQLSLISIEVTLGVVEGSSQSEGRILSEFLIGEAEHSEEEDGDDDMHL